MLFVHFCYEISFVLRLKNNKIQYIYFLNNVILNYDVIMLLFITVAEVTYAARMQSLLILMGIMCFITNKFRKNVTHA